MTWTSGAAVALGLGVILGAFGAHALKSRLDPESLGIWEKAVFYHFVHALGLLVVSRIPKTDGVGWLLVAGIVLFSGSLYLLATTGIRILGAVTPLGGLCFIAAWLLLAWRCYSK
ncbi:MAG TPA: DUF423 domain-containing protein [Bryobacteraceae bacterium]|nr:DUF423 domain-containing protein [Bryobacteraceae bacterium]